VKWETTIDPAIQVAHEEPQEVKKRTENKQN
jgi:hypothetical protein